MSELVEAIYLAILDGNVAQVQQGVKDGLAGGVAPEAILNDGMIAAMNEVGRRYDVGDFYVAEMLVSARAMQSGLALLKPYLRQANVKATGKVVLGTVKGDMHDIGKNLVGMMLEGAGFEIQDLGADVSPDKFVAAVKMHEPDVVALSALLTTTMPSMKATIEALKAAGVRDQVKIMVGGAPVNEAYAQQIGADGYSPDASQAVALAKSLLGI
jgi:5-methyltetrahydrofolate--homocysteine methyltransferase